LSLLEGTLRSHKFEKDLRRDKQKPYVSEGLKKGQSEAIRLRRLKYLLFLGRFA
jgi:hypothetical protein